jgi:virginiamycin B lyase
VIEIKLILPFWTAHFEGSEMKRFIIPGVLLAIPLIAATAEPQAAPTKIDAKEWNVPWGGSTRPRDPYVDKDGKVWFVGQVGDYVAYVDPKTGEFKRYDLDPGTGPHTQIADKDGSIWYTGNRASHIGKLDPATGKITKYPMPDPAVRDPHTMEWDKDGNLWFTAQQAGFVGKLTKATGKVDLIRVGQGTRPYGIVLDKAGKVWFDMFGTNKIGMVDPATMQLKEFPLPEAGARPRRIAITSDNMVWYTDYQRGYIGRLNPANGQVKEWLAPGGAQSRPYAINVDDQDRLWFSETGATKRLVGFDARTERVIATTELSAGGYIRHMMFDPKTRLLWFGTDGGTVGNIPVPMVIVP